MSGRRTMLSAALLCALAVAGCGGSESPAPGGGEERTDTLTAQTAPDSIEARTLSRSEVRVIFGARDEVSAYCRRVARALARGREPSKGEFERVIAAVDELAELAARKPEAQTADGSTPRLALGDIAENLEGTNCDQRVVARIDEALAALPAG